MCILKGSLSCPPACHPLPHTASAPKPGLNNSCPVRWARYPLPYRHHHKVPEASASSTVSQMPQCHAKDVVRLTDCMPTSHKPCAWPCAWPSHRKADRDREVKAKTSLFCFLCFNFRDMEDQALGPIILVFCSLLSMACFSSQYQQSSFEHWIGQLRSSRNLRNSASQ